MASFTLEAKSKDSFAHSPDNVSARLDEATFRKHFVNVLMNFDKISEGEVGVDFRIGGVSSAEASECTVCGVDRRAVVPAAAWQGYFVLERRLFLSCTMLLMFICQLHSFL